MNLIGHSSPAFCHHLPDKTAIAVEQAGFDVWEIVSDGKHDVVAHKQAVRDALASTRLKAQLHAPLADCNLGSLVPDAWDASVARVDRAIRAAADLGIKRVTVHPGNHSPLSREHYDLLHEATRQALRQLDVTGREYGMDLCLENMPASWAYETTSLAQLEDLTRDVGWKFTFDYGHAHVAKKTEEFERAAKRLGNVHVHDNKGDVDAHLTLGEGTLDWQRVTRSLLRDGYAGTFVIESRGYDSGRKSLEQLRRLVRTVLA